MTPTRRDDDGDQARAILDRVESENASVLGSAMRQASDHFAGRDALQNSADSDAVEIWGRRIGRALGALFFLILLFNLFTGWFF